MNSITRAEQYDPKILNTAEAAKALGLSLSTVIRMRQRRILRAEALAKKGMGETDPLPARVDVAGYSGCIGPRFVRFGKKVFYRQEDLDAWIQNPV